MELDPENKRYFFIIDSYDSMINELDLTKSYDEAQKIGGQAVINAMANKKLGLPTSICGHHLYGISQVRVQMKKAGHMMNTFDGASGGNALNHGSSVIGKFASPIQGNNIYETYGDTKSKVVGRHIKIYMQKTYNETTGQSVTIPIKFGHKGGVWREREAVDLALGHDFYSGPGAWKMASPVFIEGMKEKNVEIPEKIQGIGAMTALFDSRPDIVDATIEIHKEVTCNAP